MGWMQFMPSTWEAYGVDANGDGVTDPYNPEDAIYAAARYLSAAGMPADTYGAIFAYNHADWYVAEVLANAACYAGIGSRLAGGFSLTPQLQVLSCQPGRGLARSGPGRVPDRLRERRRPLRARPQRASGRWPRSPASSRTSAAGWASGSCRQYGPLGLDGSEWRTYAVDGDEDGQIRRADPDDSAATLARLIWSRGSLRAGIFTHNQAALVRARRSSREAEQIEGGCTLQHRRLGGRPARKPPPPRSTGTT